MTTFASCSIEAALIGLPSYSPSSTVYILIFRLFNCDVYSNTTARYVIRMARMSVVCAPVTVISMDHAVSAPKSLTYKIADSKLHWIIHAIYGKNLPVYNKV